MGVKYISTHKTENPSHFHIFTSNPELQKSSKNRGLYLSKKVHSNQAKKVRTKIGVYFIRKPKAQKLEQK